MKYLSEFFVLYDSFFETNILLTSMSFKLNSFLLFIKVTFVYLFIINIYALSTHSYTCQKKSVKTFYSNLRCLIYTDKNYLVSFVITQNKMSHSKDFSKAFL